MPGGQVCTKIYNFILMAYNNNNESKQKRRCVQPNHFIIGL